MPLVEEKQIKRVLIRHATIQGLIFEDEQGNWRSNPAPFVIMIHAGTPEDLKLRKELRETFCKP